jgi:hypothetical protein
VEGGMPKDDGNSGYFVAHPVNKIIMFAAITSTVIRAKDFFLFTVTPLKMGRQILYAHSLVIGNLRRILN